MIFFENFDRKLEKKIKNLPIFIFLKVFLNCFILADSFKIPETSYISRLSLDGDIGNVFSPFVTADISQVFTPSDQAS